MGREAKINNKLTRKQDTFVKGILNGQSATQAALTSYNTSDPSVAKVIASENLTKPNIKEALEEALRSNGVTPDLITAEIKTLATKQVEKVSGDVKLKSLVELLKLMGAYPGTKHSNLNVNIKAGLKDLTMNQIKEELRVVDAELKEILEKDTPIPTQTSLK